STSASLRRTGEWWTDRPGGATLGGPNRRTEERAMARCLVVAHRTLIGDHLLDEVRHRIDQGPCRFHLLVPVRHPSDKPWSDGQVRRAALDRLEDGLEVFRSIGAE